MLDFRKLFLTCVTLALFASLSMSTAAPMASTLNLPADNLTISQCAFDVIAIDGFQANKVVQITEPTDVGDVALTASTMTKLNLITAPTEYGAARVSQAAQLSVHFYGVAATDVALEASTRSPSPPNAVLNHNTAKLAEKEVANAASNSR